MTMTPILMALAPIFFVLALGYVAGRSGTVDNRNVGGFNAFVMNFALPASLFAATASATRSEMLAQAPLFAIAGAVMLLLFLIWCLTARAIWKATAADASLQALTIAFPNLAGVGLPIAAATLGPAGTIPVAVALSAGSILVTPIALIVVDLAEDSPSGARDRVKRTINALRRAACKPVVASPILGILFCAVGVKPSPVVEACLVLVGQAAAGVALFLTGLILSAQPLHMDQKIIGATAMADIVRPLLTAAVVFVLPLDGDMARAAVLLASVPSGFFGILFAVQGGCDSTALGSMVLTSTVVSAATMSIAICVLFPH